MKERASKFQILIGLKQVNDLDLVLQPIVFRETGFNPTERPTVETIITEINLLVDSFNYLESPEFLTSVQHRSPQFQEMKRRLHTPEKNEEQKARLMNLLSNDLAGNELIGMIPAEKRRHLLRLRQLVGELS